MTIQPGQQGFKSEHPKPSAVEQGVDFHSFEFIVPGLHCAGCISKVEKTLLNQPGVASARVNLSAKRVSVMPSRDGVAADDLLTALDGIGFPARLSTGTDTARQAGDAYGRSLLKALAVAGFAAGNVMLLSVSVWSGAEAATRDLLHWISSLIALPAVVYAGQPFFRSAWAALRHGRLNMDVPISLAVILASGMSLYETATGGAHAYFDAAVMLLFFLLAGRYLDHMMRARARSAVTELVALKADHATILEDHGRHRQVPVADVVPGMHVIVMAGDRVPVDGEVTEGVSSLDRSLVTGEFAPERIAPGDTVEAGTVNLSGPVTLKVTAVGEDTFLAEMAELMATAEQGRSRYVRLADRAAGVYAPVVHLAAFIAFCGWYWASGDWHFSLLTAISVLIITCPCALGLAVPAVQVVACGELFRNGIVVKDGAALERLSETDTVVLDKTGTLTLGRPVLASMPELPPEGLAIAAGLASRSSHPLAKALSSALAERGVDPVKLTDIHEQPGYGLAGVAGKKQVRLGSRDWCDAAMQHADANITGPELVLAIAGREPAAFGFADELRDDAKATVGKLNRLGLRTIILSGDREPVVAGIAGTLGIGEWRAACKPQDKVAFLETLRVEGARVLMVGDGINDAPALAAAHASMAPSTAADVSGTAAGLVFLGHRLGAITTALRISRTARRLVWQNFGFAALYNVVAVPVAVAGLATPLVAAIAMASSSLVVTANALRLRLERRQTGTGARTGQPVKSAVEEAAP